MVSFLGVATEPAGPAIAAHLDLPEGVGLAITQIVPDSPAAEVFKVNDILVKLDGQWLADPRQLAVLVRLMKPGQEAKIEYLRKGVAATAKVKLGQREWTPLPEAGSPAGSRPGNPLLFPFPQGMAPLWPDRTRVLPDDDGDFGLDISVTPDRKDGSDGDTVIRSTIRSVRKIVEDGRAMTLTETDGHREFKVEDADGKVLFEGPVNTDKEIADIPKEYRTAFDRLAGSGRSRGGIRIERRPFRGPAL